MKFDKKVEKPKYEAPKVSELDLARTMTGIFLDSETIAAANSLS